MIRVPFTLTVSARLTAATMALTVLAMGALALIIDRYVDAVARENADAAAHRVVLLLESPHLASDAVAMRLAAAPLGFDATVLTRTGTPSTSTTPTPPVILQALRTAPPCVPISIGPSGDRYRFIVGAPWRKTRLVVWRRIDRGDEIDRRLAAVALAFVVVLAMPTLLACVFLVRAALRPVDRSFERLREYAVEAAHEIRAPLSAIVTEADLALARPREPHAYRDALTRIESAATDLHAIARDVLLGASSAQVEPVDVAAIVHDVSHDFQLAAQGRGVRLRTATSRATALASRASVRRVATALIDNAVRFARRDVLVEVHEGDGDIVLRVADDGPGIRPGVAARVFARRWREERREGVNVGLGLTLAKELVERYGGSIGFEPGRRVGACAVVRLPARRGTSSTPLAARSDTRTRRGPRR